MTEREDNRADNSIVRQGLTYIVVGGSTALLELGLFQLLYEYLHVELAIANIIAVVVATCTNFLINRNVTFASTSNPARSIVLYAMLFCINLFISTNGIALLVSCGVHSAIAKIMLQGCIVLWNFVLYRKVIFV